MSDALHIRVEEILDLWTGEIDRLQITYGLHDGTKQESFEQSVRRHFKDGVHRAYFRAASSFLRERFPTQLEMAQDLELDDHSSISHMLKKGRIDGHHLTYLAYKYGGEFLASFPRREDATKQGYIETTSHVRKAWLRDSLCDEKITLEELEFLLRTLSDEAWRRVQRSGRIADIERIGNSMLDEVHGLVPRPWRIRSVPMIEQTNKEWRESFLLCLRPMLVKGA